MIIERVCLEYKRTGWPSFADSRPTREWYRTHILLQELVALSTQKHPHWWWLLDPVAHVIRGSVISIFHLTSAPWRWLTRGYWSQLEEEWQRDRRHSKAISNSPCYNFAPSTQTSYIISLWQRLADLGLSLSVDLELKCEDNVSSIEDK